MLAMPAMLLLCFVVFCYIFAIIAMFRAMLLLCFAKRAANGEEQDAVGPDAG